MYHHDHGYMKRLREGTEHPYGFHMCWTQGKPGYLLLGCSVISVSFIVWMLTLLLIMPLTGLCFCVGLDFVTPSLKTFLSKHHHHHHQTRQTYLFKKS
jgi:hypothetical protein